MQGSASSGNENGQQLVPSGKDMDKVRSELAFERQCNSELGRRNRRYLKVIDTFDSHRSVMDSHIAELSENLCKLTTLLQQGKISRPFYNLSHIHIFVVHQFRRVSQ